MFIDRLRDRFARRQRYNRMVSEIQALSRRELVDIGANRSDMIRQAWEEIYG